MLSRMLIWLSLLMGTVLVGGEKLRFDGYKLYRIVPANSQHLSVLKDLQGNLTDLLFWNDLGGVNRPVEVVVPPETDSHFSSVLQKYGLTAEIRADDLQRLIDLEQPRHVSKSFGWTKYNTLEEINEWLDSLAQQLPNVVSTIVGGQSYEGRQIKGVKVSYKSGNPGVFLESGIHANEWIGPAAATWILNQLLSSKDPNVRDIAENFDWYIFPSVNPDGYTYTHTTNRLWRKTRSPSSDTCYGVDANRNWGFHWMGEGASSNPCSSTYAGPRAFSEVEMKTLSDFIASVSSNIKVYIDFHSFGQLLMFPYSYTYQHSPDHDILMKIGVKAGESLASRYGTEFEVGTIAETIYIASGSSLDWVYADQGITLAYVYELGNTMIQPPDTIVPISEEVLDSVVTILQESRNVTSKTIQWT